MVSLKPRHLRGMTNKHIPMTLISFLKNHSKDVLFTGQKVEITAGERVLHLDPLWITFASIASLSEKLDIYFTREELNSVEAQIKETSKQVEDRIADEFKGKVDSDLLQAIADSVKDV